MKIEWEDCLQRLNHVGYCKLKNYGYGLIASKFAQLLNN